MIRMLQWTFAMLVCCVLLSAPVLYACSTTAALSDSPASAQPDSGTISDGGTAFSGSAPPPPPSYCETIQPYLDRAGQAGNLNVKLTCFDLPGITEVGFYGTREFPTDNRLDRCFPSAEAATQALRSEGEPVDLGYTYTWTRFFDVQDGLELGFLGRWAPKLKAEGARGQSVDVTVKYEGVRIRRISDLKKSLTACIARAAATECLKELGQDGIVFSPLALVGRMVVSIKTASNTSIGGNLKVPNAIGFNIRSQDTSAGTLTLESAGDVTIAGALRQTKELVPPGTECCEFYWPDTDGDGFGDVKAQPVQLCVLKSGYVKNNSDCYDQSKDAHPKQTGFFAHHRGDGSFDYNCNGEAEYRDVSRDGGCHSRTRVGVVIECRANPGWAGEVPACGKQQSWLDDCDVTGVNSCSLRETSTKTQHCR